MKNILGFILGVAISTGLDPHQKKTSLGCYIFVKKTVKKLFKVNKIGFELQER